MASLSTHVLDTTVGGPAVGVRVTLETTSGDAIGEAVTDTDGRVSELATPPLTAGDYVLRFDTAAYFGRHGVAGFYPEVSITFTVQGDQHFHVPLLLSPFGYSTYRGS